MMRVVVDTNVIIDFLNMREPHYEAARLLMLIGKAGEVDLWMSASQVTDIIYIASNGGRASELPAVLQQIEDLRTFVKVFPTGAAEVDRMLASDWDDPEDRLLFEIAIACNANAIVTRDAVGFQTDVVKVCNCEEFFTWLREEHGLDYAEVAF